MEKKISTKEIIGWVVTILCTVAILATKNNSIWTNPLQPTYCAITIFYILLTAFELVDNIVIALMLPFTYLFFNIAPAAQVFNGWVGNIPWLIMAGFVISLILQRVGLLNRIVYWTLSKTGSSYTGIIFGIAIACVVLELLTSNKTYLIMPTIALALCEGLNLGKSKPAVGIFLAAAVGSVGSGAFLYNPTFLGNMLNLMSQVAPVDASGVTYITFLLHNLPMVIVFLLVFLFIAFSFKPEEKLDGKDVMRAKLQEMGPMSGAEKYSAAVSIAAIILLMTTNIHKLNILYIFVLWTIAFFIPYIGIGKKEDLQKVNWVFIFFTVAFISIGTCASAVGIGEVASNVLTPILAKTSGATLYGGFYMLGFIINLLMTPLAAMAGLSVPIAQIASDLGVTTLPVAYCFNFGLCEVILPYEIVKYLVFYAYGMFSLGQFAKVTGLKSLLTLIFVAFIMVPWWGMMGLM